MVPLEKVALAIRMVGFPKFASEYIRAGGEEAPEVWDLSSAATHIGTKLAALDVAEAEVRTGVRAADSIDEVKLASTPTDFTAEFHAVNRLANGLDKIASADAKAELAARRLNLWGAMKTAAERTPDTLSALVKTALRVWSETVRTGEKTASSRAEREAYALSFAANYLVDSKIAAAYESREISLQDAIKLSHLTAEAALEDLAGVVKVAVDPRLVGAGIGAAGGAVAGAVADKDNRWRGAGMGALMGAPTGALVGQMGKEIFSPNADKMRKGQEGLHRMRAYASHLGNGVPELVEQHANDILAHFGEGRKDVPPILASKFGPGIIDQMIGLKKTYSTPVI